MTEISALDKHACPACGAQAEWNPGKQKLVCPYCGTESPYVIDRDTGKAVENDLVKALRELPEEQRGWNTDRRSVQCQSCKAVMVFDPSRVGQNCEFCGSPALVAYSEIKAPIRPECLLPFKIPAERIRDDMRRWLKSHWLAPNTLARTSLIDTVHSLYIPVLDVRRQCPLSVGSRGRTLLLRQRAASRLPGPHRHAAGTPRALGAGLGRNYAHV